MRRKAKDTSGYPIRAVLMPVIPVRNWEETYADFLGRLLVNIPIRRLTLGGICIYKGARWLMEQKLGRENEISRHIDEGSTAGDGRMRYSPRLRIKMYAHMIRMAREIRPDIELALCLEEAHVWEAVGLEENVGQCNCVL